MVRKMELDEVEPVLEHAVSRIHHNKKLLPFVVCCYTYKKPKAESCQSKNGTYTFFCTPELRRDERGVEDVEIGKE